MNSRNAILSKLRLHARPSDLPQIAPGIQYEDPQRQFVETLAFVGGTCVVVRDRAEAHAHLATIEPYAQAAKRCSLVPGVGETNFDLAAIDDPHALQDVDYVVLAGELAVAENGAVWVSGEGVRHRVLYFLTQHLSLVVPAASLVHNLHEAYARLPVGKAPFGTFISGPSKTADIEQALVIGAHGARSLTVFLVEQL
ncbi:MAG: LUD domain-containing protein [Planctomycetaceae bacterium]|nr:LUD domain-containing protein [Planctomycetaceae bacterium]